LLEKPTTFIIAAYCSFSSLFHILNKLLDMEGVGRKGKTGGVFQTVYMQVPVARDMLQTVKW
jgi:hypothetical protein